MDINYDLIQTTCAVASLFISFFALNKVYSLKKTIKNSGKVGNTKMSIKGDRNKQVNSSKTNMQ